MARQSDTEHAVVAMLLYVPIALLLGVGLIVPPLLIPGALLLWGTVRWHKRINAKYGRVRTRMTRREVRRARATWEAYKRRQESPRR